MYQFQSLMHSLNSNVPMHVPVNLSFSQTNSAIRSSFFNCSLTTPQPTLGHCYYRKTSIFKVIQWAILINPKVIWKFTMTRPCWAGDMVYYILNAPLRIPMIFLQNYFRFQHIFLIFNNSFNILLEPLIMHNGIVHVHLDSSIQHLSLSNHIFIILRLSYIEIKLHTSTFITESLRCNYITYWDQEMNYSQKMNLLLGWMRKNFLSELNTLSNYWVNTLISFHTFFHYGNMDLV